MPHNVISFKQKGSFFNVESFFKRTLKRDYLDTIDRYGQLGVELLREATPKDTGETADAWSYRIEEDEEGIIKLVWTNSNSNEWANVVLMIVYGHALQNGSYIEPNDFITPALSPMLTNLARKVWREVTK